MKILSAAPTSGVKNVVRKLTKSKSSIVRMTQQMASTMANGISEVKAAPTAGGTPAGILMVISAFTSI